MNDQNLRPLHQSNEEATRNGRKGGIASGKSRRRNKTLRQLSRTFLNAPVDDAALSEVLRANGFDNDDLTNAARMILTIATEAFAGNIRAAELLIKLTGEDPDQKRKDDEMKLKRDLIKQQTVKLKHFNYGDESELDWILRYHPDNTADEPWRQIALMEIEEALEAGKDPAALGDKYGSWLENYVTRRIADYLIKDKRKKLIKDGYETPKDTDLEEFSCE